jgi:hypothetical protein
MIPCMRPEPRRGGQAGVEPRALAKPGPAPRSCALVARGSLLGFLKVHQPNSRAA